jgi:hypothetical protein
MNDQLKYMIAGATIAIISGVAGGLTVGLTNKQSQVRPPMSSPVYMQRPDGAPIHFPPQSVSSGSSQFSGSPNTYNLAPNPGPPNTLNLRPRLTGPPTSEAFQKIHQAPAVKQAQEAYLEAQKKLFQQESRPAQARCRRHPCRQFGASRRQPRQRRQRRGHRRRAFAGRSASPLGGFDQACL